MYKIALFSPVLADDNSLALKKYIELCNKNLCDNPIIFCDINTIHLTGNIPIFSSLYMKQKFNDYIIITDIENIDYIDNDINVLAIYNEIGQECVSTKNNIYCVSNSSNIEDSIRSIAS